MKSELFEEGNIQVAFHGIMMAVTCQVSVSSTDKRVSFESREQDMMDFESSNAFGILQLPGGDAEGFLAITNASANKVTVEVAIGTKSQEIPLFPRETHVVHLNDGLERSSSGGTLINLQHTGKPGDIITTGYVLDLKNGYSSAFAMIDPKIMRSSVLAGAHVRVGIADPTEGFPPNTSFSSPLLLANVSDSPLTAHVSLDYTVESEIPMTPVDPKSNAATERIPGTVSAADVLIAPMQVRRIELADALGKLGLKTPIEEVGVDISYQGPPGSLIGHLVSVDQTGDYSFEVPIKDPSAMNEMTEGIYPWTLEDGARTVLHLKNTTDKTARAWATLTYTGGTYNIARITFQPHQTVAIDIQGLKDSKKPDAGGKLLPADATHGQLAWFQEIPYSLIGRAEQTNTSQGIARSFSCGAICCDNFDEEACESSSACSEWGASPKGLSGSEGGSGNLHAYIYGYDCYNNPFGPNMTTADSWSSDNTAVATVDSSGDVSYVGDGSVNIEASIDTEWYESDWVSSYQMECIYGSEQEFGETQ